MKIFVRVRVNSKEKKIEQIDKNHFVIAVKESPVDGKANIAVAKALCKHFDIPLSRIKLISGFSSKQKIFDIV